MLAKQLKIVIYQRRFPLGRVARQGFTNLALPKGKGVAIGYGLVCQRFSFSFSVINWCAGALDI